MRLEAGWDKPWFIQDATELISIVTTAWSRFDGKAIQGTTEVSEFRSIQVFVIVACFSI